MADLVIRMDRTKRPPPSTVHGDRAPDDPQYRVAYWHQGLPYDANELLVPPDDKAGAEPWDVLMDNGDGTQRRVRYSPLYDKRTLATLNKLKERLTRVANAPSEPMEAEEVAAPTPQSIDDDVDEVNFISFLRGEAKYTFAKLRDAFKKRFHRHYDNLPDLISDLILDEKVLPEDQVAPQYLRLLGPKGSE